MYQVASQTLFPGKFECKLLREKIQVTIVWAEEKKEAQLQGPLEALEKEATTDGHF